MDLGLKDKVAIVTGGSEGIGKSAAHRIAEEGGRVVIVARRAEVLETAAADIRATARAGAVLPVAGDVTEPATAARTVEAALQAFGGIDILVNNAGTALAKPFEAVSDEEWQTDFDIKFWAAVRFTRAVIPEMRKRGGGRIINVTNLAGRMPTASTMPTAAARAAGIALTKGLSKDLAAANILVNTVCIGFIKSAQHERRYQKLHATRPGASFEELYAEEAKRRGVPLGRVGETREAGDVIAFLASARASYLTGVAINIDGGTAACV